MENANTFDLKPAEIATPITFREGGRKFRVVHQFRPPQFADWLEYETKLNRSVEVVGAHTRFDQERAEAAEAIWDRIIVRVEGYCVGSREQETANSKELRDAFPESWREQIPVLHKMAAIQLLAQVFPTAGDETEVYHFDPAEVEVHLEAGRGGKEYTGLVHTLRRPTVRQQKEFSRVVSTALYVRGSRTEKSLLPSRLREMVRFYDELVTGVRGYSVSGQAATREDAVKWMDALHKQTAVAALFNFEDSEAEEERVASSD
ncbi:MAG: hypothetical protein HYX72_00800 [Acidobacteria bacterium]|nr:hypothetical protein [Acidobacteriota bacterium]